MEDFFRNQYGEMVEKPADRLVTFRPSAYAVVINEAGQLLAARSAFDGRLLLPGGGIELGEAIMDCVTRECREETGYRVIASPTPKYFRETFFHNKLSDQYHHVVGLFFIGQIENADHGGQVEDAKEIASVEWVDLSITKEADWGYFCWPVIQQHLEENKIIN